MQKKSHIGINPEGESPFESFPAPFDTVQDYTKKYSNTTRVKGQLHIKVIVKLITFIAKLFSWNCAYWFGSFLGTLFYWLGLRKDVAIRNLDIAYGETKTTKEKKAIYKASLINFGRLIMNYMRLPFQNETFWRENIRITNEALLNETMNRKKGVLVLSGHIGTWDLAAGKIGMSGYPISVVGKQTGNPVIDKTIIDARISMNLGSIGTKNAMSRIFAGLKQGEMIAMALDQNLQASRGMFIKWFGTTASSVRSASYVVQETKIPVITAAMFQRGPKEFELIVKEEYKWVTYGDTPEEELLHNAQLMSEAVENIIKDEPGHWFWIHRRWKTQPEGMPDLYE